MLIELFKKITGFDLEQVESCYQDNAVSKYKIVADTSLYDIFDKISIFEEKMNIKLDVSISYDDVYVIL